MNGKIVKGLAFLICMNISIGIIFAQNTINGKVIDSKTENGITDVRIIINEGNSTTSTNDGKFTTQSDDLSVRPKKVEAYKSGLELANWEYEEGNLTIYMREATIKTLQGTLSSNGQNLANQTIQLEGNRNYVFETDSKGQFIVKIPYSETINSNSNFSSDGETLSVNNLSEDKEKALVTVNLESKKNINIVAAKELSTVQVLYQKQIPVSNMIVTINGTSYITSDDGTFKAENISPNNVNWDFEGIKPISVNTSANNNLITVILPQSAFVQIDKSNQTNEPKVDSSVIATVFSSMVSKEVHDLMDFYNEQSKEIEIRNQRISYVTDSITKNLNLDQESREELLKQLELLSSSVETTSRDFNKLKSNSLLLIKRLRSFLLQQEEKIKQIETEKALQEQKFKQNLLLVLYILGIASLLLVISIFIAKRINARKKVIERIKNQLVEAQLIAKLASMNYFFKKKRAEYSEQFFEVLGIRDDKRIKSIQRSNDNIIHPELLPNGKDSKVHQELANSIKGKKPLHMEIKVLSDENEELFVDLRTKLELDSSGKPEIMYSTLQDITEKKEKELQLIEAKQQAELANNVKEEFLSTMSHEIRTPLNAIIGLTNHLINNKPQKHQMDNLNTLKFSGDHLLNLVNDILDFNKIKAGKIQIERKSFDVKELVTSTQNSMKLIAIEKNIKLSIDIHQDIPQEVVGDKVRLNQVLTNLISNGIKFTEKGSVVISVQPEKKSKNSDYIHFSVKDTGIGIAQNKLTKIFESFEQEDISTSTKYGGTGLGLAISKQLVELMGGELQVKSTVGEGSEFYFTIPFGTDKTEISISSTKQAPLISSSFSELNILCVEDNEVNQLVISQYFKGWNIKNTMAGTGAEAIEKFKNEKYDLVFMDIRLPDMQGHEVVEKINAQFPDNKSIFIAMTAELNNKLKQKIESSGIIDYLNKPFSEPELKSIITKYQK